jgi:hypothetical protein
MKIERKILKQFKTVFLNDKADLRVWTVNMFWSSYGMEKLISKIQQNELMRIIVLFQIHKKWEIFGRWLCPTWLTPFDLIIK